MNPVITKFGSKWWYDSDGKLHREDGPAIEWAYGSNAWYKHDKLHREDGPAIEADQHKEYWLEGMYYTEKEYWEKIKQLKILKKCKLFELKDKEIDWL